MFEIIPGYGEALPRVESNGVYQPLVMVTKEHERTGQSAIGIGVPLSIEQSRIMPRRGDELKIGEMVGCGHGGWRPTRAKQRASSGDRIRDRRRCGDVGAYKSWRRRSADAPCLSPSRPCSPSRPLIAQRLANSLSNPLLSPHTISSTSRCVFLPVFGPVTCHYRDADPFPLLSVIIIAVSGIPHLEFLLSFSSTFYCLSF